jgi:hypothetical protein
MPVHYSSVLCTQNVVSRPQSRPPKLSCPPRQVGQFIQMVQSTHSPSHACRPGQTPRLCWAGRLAQAVSSWCMAGPGQYLIHWQARVHWESTLLSTLQILYKVVPTSQNTQITEEEENCRLRSKLPEHVRTSLSFRY